jgi:hypothetical protein
MEKETAMTEYLLSKPSYLSRYAQHQLVSKVTNGARVLFTDFGEYLILRGDSLDLDLPIKPPKNFKDGDIFFFELSACVGTKNKGKHQYFSTTDWRSRHEWLREKSLCYGFEIISLTCSSEFTKIKKASTSFTVDQTDFSGVLKVNNSRLFMAGLKYGIGNKGKAFGFGMMNIN